MTKTKLFLSLLATITFGAALAVPLATVASADDTVLSYSVKEARAYSAKVSLSGEVIKANGTVSAACDPKTDPYKCDKQRYNQALNCPTPPGVGGSGALPSIPSPAGTAQTGKAGFTTSGPQPPQSTAVRLNEILSLGRLTRAGPALESGGLASKRYVDLDGRQVPEAHTESDGFSPNRSRFEERCYPVNADGTFKGGTSYTHLLSKSGATPQTFHFGECLADECRFVSSSFPSGANRATTTISLVEVGGKVTGQVLSTIEGFSASGGAFTAEAITTYISFSSDGTAAGLSWSVISQATGTKISGTPASIPQGGLLAAPGFAVGMAAPWVEAKPDGKQLTIIAPGLVVATEQQTVYYAGGELSAGMDRATPVTFQNQPLPSFVSSKAPVNTFSLLGTGPVNISPTPAQTTTEEATRTIAIKQADASRFPAGAILGLGGLALLLLLAGWLQRFTWGRRLYGIQPFKFFYWAYRAFVRT